MTTGRMFLRSKHAVLKKPRGAFDFKSSAIIGFAREISIGLLAGASFAGNTLFCKKLQEKAGTTSNDWLSP